MNDNIVTIPFDKYLDWREKNLFYAMRTKLGNDLLTRALADRYMELVRGGNFLAISTAQVMGKSITYE